MQNTSPRIAIIDFGINNLFSIQKALTKVGCSPFISVDKNEILNADGLVLPGVGAFNKAIKYLDDNDLSRTLKEFAKSDKYILGICLGMQLLMESSEEFGFNKGLGLIKGSCKKFDSSQLKVPNINWIGIDVNNELDLKSPLNSIISEKKMYFTHSYYVLPKDKKTIIATSKYVDFEFCSAIQSNKVIGLQFHPEKSSIKGIEILNNFKNLVLNDIK